ncbi:50S ribosomal protein L13 [Candidatus Falkowbacteria bacterium]|nr:50S ribosomal protein L13 [Candidatus Falkowbacteria bacterium]
MKSTNLNVKTQRKTITLDAKGVPVGRLATQIAKILMGKHKVGYTPHINDGDFVVVINSDKIIFTGNKLAQKVYRHHSGYPGGLKEIKVQKVFSENPGKVIIHAVDKMLPKNRQRKEMLKRLTVLRPGEHIK